jgi:hypothetical protein
MEIAKKHRLSVIETHASHGASYNDRKWARST